MKNLIQKCTLLVLLMFSHFIHAQQAEVYSLTTYRLTNAQQGEAVEQYIKQAWLPALHKVGIKNVGVFKPVATDTARAGKIILVLIPYRSLNHYEEVITYLNKDEQHLKNGASFLGAPHTNPPYQRKEITLMRAFKDMPKLQTPVYSNARQERVYELRSYEGPTDNLYRSKVKMFNEGGEITLFKRLNFNAVFYADVIAGSRMPNLIYMTTFENMASRDAHWKAFVDDPQWKQLLTLDEYKNTVSKADIWLLKPTEYSDY